jgi:PAS domain S-box-containing protein
MTRDDELSASENLLASALGREAQGALVSDAQRLTVYCNAEYTRVTGYGMSEMLGRNCDILQGPGTDPKTIEEIRKTLSAGLTFSGRILNYRRDGTAFWNQLTISPVSNSQGVLINYVSVQRDVTDAVELELTTMSAVLTTLEGTTPTIEVGIAPSHSASPAVEKPGGHASAA